MDSTQNRQRLDKTDLINHYKGRQSGKELPSDPNKAQERLDRETRPEPGAPLNGDNVHVEMTEYQDEQTPNEKRQGTGATSQGGI